jgi:hypothetical protein
VENLPEVRVYFMITTYDLLEIADFIEAAFNVNLAPAYTLFKRRASLKLTKLAPSNTRSTPRSSLIFEIKSYMLSSRALNLGSLA